MVSAARLASTLRIDVELAFKPQVAKQSASRRFFIRFKPGQTINNQREEKTNMSKKLLVLLTVLALSVFGFACKSETAANNTDTSATATDTASTMATDTTATTGTSKSTKKKH